MSSPTSSLKPSSPPPPPPPPASDFFENNPLINTVTGYIAHLQEQNMFNKKRLQSFRHNFLITIGFLVLLYCLIHIQILFFWFLKIIFRLLFKLISIIFWLPLATLRFLIPKKIDYDVLFPLFWLCSISSFYLSKFSHENICQFYDQHLVRRYKIFNYDQTKREEMKRYLFIITFTVFLLLQTLFILIPIALSIRHQHENTKVSSTPVFVTQTTTIKSTTTKSPVKEAVETMGENLYQRFIDAFTDENETSRNEKRSPLVSDEQLEDTFKTIQKTIQHKMNNLKLTNKQKEEKKSSRFQRWIVYYLKAPFQKWEGIKSEVDNSNIEHKEDEEENVELNSSSSPSISDTDESDEEDDEDEDDEHITISERIKQRLDTMKDFGEKIKDNVKSKISLTTEDEEDTDDDEEDDDDDDSSSLREQLMKPIKTIQNIKEEVVQKISSSTTDSDDEDSDDEDQSTTDKIKEQFIKPIETVKNIAEKMTNQLHNKLHPSDVEDNNESGYESDNEEDEQLSKLTDKIKETLANPVEKVKTVASDIKNKITSSMDKEDQTSSPITDKIKDSLTKPIQTAKDLGEKVITNVKSKLSSSASSDDDEEEHSSILDRVKENVLEPIETTMTNLRDKLPSLSKEKKDLSLIDRTKQTAEQLLTPIKDQISSEADDLKHKAGDIVESVEEYATNVIDKSSEFVKDKTEQIKEQLPKSDKILSKIQHDVVEPLEVKASKIKKNIKTKTTHLQATVVNQIKSLKKEKKPKSLTEKAKDKFKSLSNTLQEKLPGQKKKKKSLKLTAKQKLNGWFDEAWNVWHQMKTKLAHIFTLSTKHARHLPRYNTTSLYTAYTDLKCYDYSQKINRYRLLKRNHLYFLNAYRQHSPFPVYLSILKSNGPKCYRHYPNSSCGIILKSSNRTLTTQLYRFVRFWAMIGIIIIILSVIYKYFTSRKKPNPTSFHRPSGSDRSSNKKQQTIVSNPTDLSRSVVTTQKTSSDNQNTMSSNINTQPLNEQIDKQLRLWLQREQNDGFRNLSETCRVAINNTFSKQLERLSVETLQFANAKIRNVSQNNNNNRGGETTADKIIINAILDIDHLILNIVNTFKEQHFSLEIQKLSGQLYILLVINSNQYSIEANLQQLQINPVNIIDPNHVFSIDEKQTVIKTIDETINRTVVRCTFRLSDNQENANPNLLYNSSLASNPDTTKTRTSPTHLSTSSIQTTASRSHQSSPTRYHLSDSIPTVLINDTNHHLYTNELLIDKEPKRLLVRIVKAVKLHDVEQPYCILELNHPKQIHQTTIAKNGLNPFWDERFLFECDDQSNQLHLQIIDRKKTNKKIGNNYVDTIYADALIPFSYVTSTVYKQDVQISPQYPESIIRIEFSTLSEEEALAANNGYDVESLTDSQNWTFNDREGNKIEHDYPQRYQQLPTTDYLTSSYDAGSLSKHYGVSSNLYDDERDYASTLPRSGGLHSTTNAFSPLTPRDGGILPDDKPHKSKSFMNSLKHLTLPRRKHNKTKYENNPGSQTSSITQLNNSIQSPQTNLTSYSLSSALPGPHPEYSLPNIMDDKPMRRSRSISQSFRNLFRSNSKKKANAAKADALGEFENGTHHYIVDNRNYLSTSAPTSKKLSFLQRRKSKQKAKQQSTNSLSSYDCSRIESVRDTPIRANVGHPVTMTKSLVR